MIPDTQTLQTARHQMIQQQLRCGEVLDDRILRAISDIPREMFVGPKFQGVAYADTEIPLPCGELMWPPLLEGRCLQALELQPADRVLEVGTGSGYLTACLSQLGGQVSSIDIHTQLVELAQPRLEHLHIGNCELRTADVYDFDAGQYDAIVVTGSIPKPDPRFERWLRPGGRLFVIVGKEPLMEAWLIRRVADTHWNRHALFETSTPPLIHAPEPPAFLF